MASMMTRLLWALVPSWLVPLLARIVRSSFIDTPLLTPFE
jgi:hypothetical protein